MFIKNTHTQIQNTYLHDIRPNTQWNIPNHQTQGEVLRILTSLNGTSYLWGTVTLTIPFKPDYQEYTAFSFTENTSHLHKGQWHCRTRLAILNVRYLPAETILSSTRGIKEEREGKTTSCFLMFDCVNDALYHYWSGSSVFLFIIL